MLHEVKLGTLQHTAGGTVDASFSEHVKRATEDCYDRPGCDKPREVTIKLAIKPIVDERGYCEETKMECQITSKVPAHISRPINCKIRKGGKLVFDDMADQEEEHKSA